jgi:EpsD family peptidyl-prolyl cis-trans isomerase
MINRNVIVLSGLAGCLISLAACGSKQPGDDAVATVNGYEVTLAELNHEMTEQGVQNLEDPQVRRAALQAIINRKLLMGLAEERELDRTPEFILREQRMRDQMLAEAAIQYLAPTSGEPDAEGVAAFIQNANAAGERTIYQVDALRLAVRPSPEVMRALERASTFTEIGQIIQREKLPGQAGQIQWDSAVIPAELTRQLNALPDGEPFVMAEGDSVLTGVIRNKVRQPLTTAQTRNMAQAVVGQQSIREKVGSWLEEARSSAEIEYADDFDPAAPVEQEQDGEPSALQRAAQPEPAGQT